MRPCGCQESEGVLPRASTVDRGGRDCSVAEQLEDFVLANAPEHVASMRATDEAIERGQPGIALADAIAEFEAEHGPLDNES